MASPIIPPMDINNIDHNTIIDKLLLKPPLIVGASIGNCVHIAGVANFLRIAESIGIKTVLLGTAVSPQKLVEAIDKMSPDIVGISYRLTPEIGEKILDEFLGLLGKRKPILLFGGTSNMADIAKKTGRFAYVFTGDESFAQIEKVLRMIQGYNIEDNSNPITIIKNNDNIISRLQNLPKINEDGHCIPLLRHHFGLPSLDETIEGIKTIADSEVLDVISIAPDQNAQQFFFQPDKMNPQLDGAGGVPVRDEKDLKRIKDAAQRGSFPFMRIYSGTQDLQKWAELSVKEMNNAWGAVPLFWYSELDGRSNRKLELSIRENQAVIKWYADQSLPVEILEAHQWSLRDAPDAVAVAAAYIGAYNTRVLGVRNFIGQYMFNTPRFTSPLSDLAKMTAQYVMIESLSPESFTQWREVRPGLSHFSGDLDIAKGQLATAISFALGLRPHIIHVVSFTEADHAASAKEVIESCKIVIGTLKNTLLGIPDPLKDPRISKKRIDIIEETSWILGTINNLGRHLGAHDSFTDPKTLSMAVQLGILDAPHLRGQPCALGLVETSPVDGGCRAINFSNGQPLPERDRLMSLLKGSTAKKITGTDAQKFISTWHFPKKIKSSNSKMITWSK
jgi:methylmalonyl-CoA mutase cobalamin-binding subunit